MLLSVSAPVPAQAPDFLPRVQAAVARLDATDLDADWHFSMEVTEGEEIRGIESDPAREGYARRRLVTVDGDSPDESQLEAFRKAEKKRIDDLDPDTKGYSYLVDTDTLTLEDAGGTLTRYGFVPRVRDLGSSRERLRGTLLLNNGTGQVDRLEIQNTEPLSPAFSVTVDTYRLVLTFGEEQGERLLQMLESTAVGKAGFLKSFDSNVVIRFHDFQRAEP